MTSHIFLTSSATYTAKHLGKKLHAKQRKLKTLFITTAADGEAGDKSWLQADRQALVDGGFQLTDYTVVGKTIPDILEAISTTNVIMMSGGNTSYLLEHLKKTSADDIITQAVSQGKVYIGSSAGSIVAGPDISHSVSAEDADDDITNAFTGLSLTDVSILPHWGNPKTKKYVNQAIRAMERQNGKYILLSDHQYLEVFDQTYRIIDVTDS